MLRLAKFLAAAVVMSLAVMACAKKPVSESRILAKVNGEPILVKQFLRELRGYQSPGTLLSNDPKAFQKAKAKLLDQMIEQRVMIQEAQARHTQVPKALEDAQLSTVRSGFSGAEFERLLREQHLSESEWMQLERERLSVQQYLQDSAAGALEVSPAEVAAYFEKNRAQFVAPARVRVRQIVFETEAEAHGVLKLLRQSRADFAALARKHSRSPEGQAGGDVGFYARGELPEVFDRIFDLPVGQISEVIASEYGFHIFQVLDRRPGHPQTLEEASEAIRAQLLQEKRTVFYDQLLKKVMAKARVVKDVDLLRQITI